MRLCSIVWIAETGDFGDFDEFDECDEFDDSGKMPPSGLGNRIVYILNGRGFAFSGIRRVV